MQVNDDQVRASDGLSPTVEPVPVSPLRASIPDAVGIECRHHYGITTHDFRDGMTVPEIVYWLIRNAWHTKALTDDNHTWEVVEKDPMGWSYIHIIKNEKSPRFVLRPSWHPDGPGATWFTQEYRIATFTSIAWEIADLLAWADRWDADAERQRDTIRGRKARAKYNSYAKTKRREAEIVRSRWPGFQGIERTGLQKRWHEHRVPAQGMSAEGQDPQGLGATPAGPVGETDAPQATGDQPC